MTTEQCYTAPPQQIFEEIKKAAIEIWKTYDDSFGYATEKINAIKDIENVKDNAWYITAMFDIHNQYKLINMVSDETAAMIKDAINSYKN